MPAQIEVRGNSDGVLKTISQRTNSCGTRGNCQVGNVMIVGGEELLNLASGSGILGKANKRPDGIGVAILRIHCIHARYTIIASINSCL